MDRPLQPHGNHRPHPFDATATQPPVPTRDAMPSIQVWFECSSKYLRVFRSPRSKGYLARCPACGKSMPFVVGEGGTPERQFRVSCQR